ncbi:hypothetical protein J4439_05655 [Candidatus Woesearchaeota archaeon]|nr:hypothetical protein [Candidatus Woesearchaeota archaeon]
MDLGVVGVIGRWKPLHNGGALMLDTLCARADLVKLGIGSANRYDARNPFTAEESEGMLRAYLKPECNCEFIHVPDFGHLPEHADGQRWREEVLRLYGELDCFVSGNAYVRELLKDDYRVIHPAELIPKEEQLWLRAAQVRVEMARSGPWESLVPEEVSRYITSARLDERFRSEFGLQTLGELVSDAYLRGESSEQERSHIGGETP